MTQIEKYNLGIELYVNHLKRNIEFYLRLGKTDKAKTDLVHIPYFYAMMGVCDEQVANQIKQYAKDMGFYKTSVFKKVFEEIIETTIMQSDFQTMEQEVQNHNKSLEAQQ